MNNQEESLKDNIFNIYKLSNQTINDFSLKNSVIVNTFAF